MPLASGVMVHSSRATPGSRISARGVFADPSDTVPEYVMFRLDPEQICFWNTQPVWKEVLSVAVNRPSETQLLRARRAPRNRRPPPRWSFRSANAGRRVTAEPTRCWSLKAPDGSTATFVVEAKRTVLGSQLDHVLAQLATFDAIPLVAAPYLGPSVRAALAVRGASYADSTGNLRLLADAPGLFVERSGATKDPWPSDETLRSLRGRGAGRAVRALVDYRTPYGVRDIARRAAVPLGTLSRVLDLLAREGLVTREPSGAVMSIDWEAAIRRWAEDYDFARSNQAVTFLEPRGLDAVRSKLASVTWTYAATGAFAAQRYAPIAPARQAAIYVEDITRTAERLRLRPAEAGANAVLVEPYDPVVFDRATIRDGLKLVAPSPAGRRPAHRTGPRTIGGQ